MYIVNIYAYLIFLNQILSKLFNVPNAYPEIDFAIANAPIKFICDIISRHKPHRNPITIQYVRLYLRPYIVNNTNIKSTVIVALKMNIFGKYT